MVLDGTRCDGTDCNARGRLRLTLEERIERALAYRTNAIDWWLATLWTGVEFHDHFAQRRDAWLDVAPRRWIRGGRVVNALCERLAKSSNMPQMAIAATSREGRRGDPYAGMDSRLPAAAVYPPAEQ